VTDTSSISRNDDSALSKYTSRGAMHASESAIVPCYRGDEVGEARRETGRGSTRIAQRETRKAQEKVRRVYREIAHKKFTAQRHGTH